jgi:calmodulin
MSTEEEAREAFNLFDKDSAGSIRTKDVGVVLQSLGFSLSAAELHAMEKDADPEGLGFVKFPEFSRQVTKAMVLANASSAEAKRTIHAFAETVQKLLENRKEPEGNISVEDLRHVLTRVGEKMSPEEFDEMCGEIGVDEGRISIEKFVNFLII